MKRLIFAGVAGYSLYSFYISLPPSLTYTPGHLRMRAENLSVMSSTAYDLLIIGGGATGAGVALDAASRGLSSCLIEQGDFAGQTSSKSTKLLHGGVRYLDKVVHLEEPQANLFLVLEGLRERSTVISNASLITNWVPLAVPCTSYLQMAYFYTGMLVYQLLAVLQTLHGPHIPWPTVTTDKALFPAMKTGLVGSVIYYDGQMNDSRLCLELLLTASCEQYVKGFQAAHIANYVKFVDFYWEDHKIAGARVKDLESGQEFVIKSKVVVNCTGPFSDRVRRLAGAETDRIVPGRGSHVILPGSYTPKAVGMLIPYTEDGRVVFLLPWEQHTILGTTDSLGVVDEFPSISQKERQFLADELSKYLDKSADDINKDIQGAFAGERPLVKSKDEATKSLLRTHEVEVLDSGLVSVLGGKWTTYRAMGEEAVSKAVELWKLSPAQASLTQHLKLYSNRKGTDLKRFLTVSFNINENTAERLVKEYGSNAAEVARLGIENISRGVDLLDGEVRYAVKCEYALHLADVLARRRRLALVNYNTTQALVPKAARIMAEASGWSKEQEAAEVQRALTDLQVFSPV